MKKYFNNYSENELEKKYDEIDDIFNKRFEVEFDETKISELEKIIEYVNEKIEKNNRTKLTDLVLGSAHLRLAQCHNELFESTAKDNKAALKLLEKNIDYLNIDEYDVLLLLNKGKYFRNTATIGKKGDYDKAYYIFHNVAQLAANLEIHNGKKLHLILDAKINMGRAKRYGYEFNEALNIFLGMYLALRDVIYIKHREIINECINRCSYFNGLLQDIKEDEIILNCIKDQNDEDIKEYPFLREYLLQILVHIGIILRKQKKYNDAEKFFYVINEIDSKNIDAQNNLAVCYRKMGYRLNSADRKEYLEKATNICSRLSQRKNRFAEINLYKCKLLMREDIKNTIEDLKSRIKSSKGNNIQLIFLLGRFYEKTNQYDKAIKCYKKIYKKNSIIARGSIGFKSYYNWGQCCIKKGEYSKAKKILTEIREELEKSHGEERYKIDVMTEVDYGWCLMQEGNYSKALEIYQSLDEARIQENTSVPIDEVHILRIYNNMMDCQIHLCKFDEADNTLDKLESKYKINWYTSYLSATLKLQKLLKKKSTNTLPDKDDIGNLKTIQAEYNEVLTENPIYVKANSGWIISTLLLYQYENKQDIKQQILQRINYSALPVTMKAYNYIADFILNESQLENSIYYDFCHINLTETNENEAFKLLMESKMFHHFTIKDRAFLLANIVKIYDSILKIKRCLRFTNDDLEKSGLPCHYTTCETLKFLLEGKESKNSHLRLWNSVYMNDIFEGNALNNLVRNMHSGDEEKKTVIEKYFGDYNDKKIQNDSNVYITSFSLQYESFQMWSIYGDNGKGCNIKFGEDFIDIRDDYENIISDEYNDGCAIYKIQYLGEGSDSGDCLGKDAKALPMVKKNLNDIMEYLYKLEKQIEKIQEEQTDDVFISYAIDEVRSFVLDRLAEIRFLFKNNNYQYENELRIVQVSHKCKVDNTITPIPKIYIDIPKKIENIEIVLGGKIDRQEMKNMVLWLKNTKKVKNVTVSKLNNG